MADGQCEQRRCPMCGGLGWTLDCNDLGKPGPRMAEFMPCFYPDCEASGQPIRSLCFKDAPFNHASMSPLDGRVMSVSEGGPEREAALRAAMEAGCDEAERLGYGCELGYAEAASISEAAVRGYLERTRDDT